MKPLNPVDWIGELDNATIAAREAPSMLDQVLIDWQESLVQLRQTVFTAIANQKRTQHQCDRALLEVNHWQQQYQLALRQGDQHQAQTALNQKQTQTEKAACLQTQLDQQRELVGTLKRNLMTLEDKVFAARTKRHLLLTETETVRDWLHSHRNSDCARNQNLLCSTMDQTNAPLLPSACRISVPEGVNHATLDRLERQAYRMLLLWQSLYEEVADLKAQMLQQHP